MPREFLALPTVNFSILEEVERLPETFEFKDPGQKQPWILCLRPPDDLELGYADDLQSKMEAKYIHGNWLDDRGKPQVEPEQFFDVKGKPSLLSREVLFFVCKLYVMQDVEKLEDAYTVEQIAGMIPYYPVAWQRIKTKFYELIKLPKDETDDTTTS